MKSFNAFLAANTVAYVHRQRVYRSFHDAPLWPSADQLCALSRSCCSDC